MHGVGGHRAAVERRAGPELGRAVISLCPSTRRWPRTSRCSQAGADRSVFDQLRAGRTAEGRPYRRSPPPSRRGRRRRPRTADESLDRLGSSRRTGARGVVIDAAVKRRNDRETASSPGRVGHVDAGLRTGQVADTRSARPPQIVALRVAVRRSARSADPPEPLPSRPLPEPLGGRLSRAQTGRFCRPLMRVPWRQSQDACSEDVVRRCLCVRVHDRPPCPAARPEAPEYGERHCRALVGFSEVQDGVEQTALALMRRPARATPVGAPFLISSRPRP